MKNYIIFSIVLLVACLTGCVGIEQVEVRPNTAPNAVIEYEGDSNCAGFGNGHQSAATLAGIDQRCVIGRSLYDVARLNEDADLIFLALGINAPGTRENFTAKLNQLLGETAAVVVCVLPVSLIEELSLMQREVMQENCVSFIDPYDAPVTILEFFGWGYDGLHYTDPTSQYLLSEMVRDEITRILGGG